MTTSFSDVSDNWDDNFSDDLSKSFDFFSLKLPLKKVTYDVTNRNVTSHQIRQELRTIAPSPFITGLPKLGNLYPQGHISTFRGVH